MYKHTLVVIISVITSAALMAQEKTRDDYLRLAKSQKIIGISFIGAGAGIVWLGASLGNKTDEHPSFDPGDVGGQAAMVVLGAGIAAIGIKMLVESGKNKKRVVSLSFKNETKSQIKNSSLVYQPMPAVSLKFNL